LHVVRNEAGEIGFRVLVGGGLGRTPIIGHVIREFLAARRNPQLLRRRSCAVYNRFGRRDNLYKARIKILVKELTPAVFTREVEAEWAHLKGGPATVPDSEIDRIASSFVPPAYDALPGDDRAFRAAVADNRGFANWVKRNVFPHKVPGYAAVTLSLKKTGVPAGRLRHPTRWTRLPISPTTTVLASCAFRTNRTSFSPTSSRWTLWPSGES
jgi:sulfite reductase (NADPH) hemoprotein beta-component